MSQRTERVVSSNPRMLDTGGAGTRAARALVAWLLGCSLESLPVICNDRLVSISNTGMRSSNSPEDDSTRGHHERVDASALLHLACWFVPLLAYREVLFDSGDGLPHGRGAHYTYTIHLGIF